MVIKGGGEGWVVGVRVWVQVYPFVFFDHKRVDFGCFDPSKIPQTEPLLVTHLPQAELLPVPHLLVPHLPHTEPQLVPDGLQIF